MKWTRIIAPLTAALLVARVAAMRDDSAPRRPDQDRAVPRLAPPAGIERLAARPRSPEEFRGVPIAETRLDPRR
jgi:hypothetical protein